MAQITALITYEIKLCVEDSTGILLFRTDLEKVVRPGVTMPAEDGITAESPNLSRICNRICNKLLTVGKRPLHLCWLKL